MSRLLLLIVLLLNSLLVSFSQVLLKKSAMRKHNSFLSEYVNIYVIAGYAIFFIVLLINIFIMKYIEMNIVSVFSESMPLVISIFTGYIFFNERINKRKIISVVLILIGIVLIII
jgi:drug/metabolite transporter (DMT)-like permease